MRGEGKHASVKWVPLEDVTELWYWGVWKEPLQSPFDTTTAIICTSRRACFRYYGNRTTDYWLAIEEGLMDEAEAEEKRRRKPVFDESSRRRENAVFKRLTYTQLIEALMEDLGGSNWSVLINPRRNEKTNEVEFDALLTASAFFEAAGVEQESASKGVVPEAPVNPEPRRRRRRRTS